MFNIRMFDWRVVAATVTLGATALLAACGSSVKLNETPVESRVLTPVNPATLPPRKPGQPYPQLPKGWLENWEEQNEVANA